MKSSPPSSSLIHSAGVASALELAPATESAWIDVVQKMESVYADLVQTQVEIEEKNAALEEAHQFIRSVLFAMTDVLIVCDVEGNIQQVNRALESLTGRAAQELTGQPLSSLFGQLSQSFFDSLLTNMQADALMDCEVALLSKEEEQVPLAVNCSHRYDAEGRRVGVVLIGRPMGELQRAYRKLNRAHEELKQAQLQLVQSEKMASLGRLVAGVAHELNNPISFVFGNMHALQSYGERIHRYLTAVEAQQNCAALVQLRDELRIPYIMADMDSLIAGTLEGAERVRDIVQDLLRYSTRQQERFCHFDLIEVIRIAVEWVSKASRTMAQTDYEMPATLALVGRKGHVQQILINLIQNAVDVMEGDECPRLQVRCCVVGTTVEVSVRDQGAGIDDEALPKLFDPFYTTKPVGKGTGLGLSISYGLALDMGGELRVDNHPDGGARFTLVLPYREQVDE